MGEHSDEIVRRRLSTEEKSPGAAIAEVVADLEGVDAGTLPPIYSRIDGVLGDVFSDPPEAEAQMEVVFTYRGYRVTVGQDGAAEFVKVG
ncbi:HalOD1 output domain-containing protein [Halobium salinum]|uniref:HalOD1 output domain-containing protein n=1 Tax=Halobium salinum TaxID=1364940 RepID=A0ABD5P6Z6_9EURY|nr:HalOD1 output domain-containing protein [Halobium salinum]